MTEGVTHPAIDLCLRVNLTATLSLAPNLTPIPPQVIPLEELKRPRVDVVVNCSGVFRDLFVNQMNLLDRAVKLAAEQDEPDEMNFVRKHAREQARAFDSFCSAGVTQ